MYELYLRGCTGFDGCGNPCAAGECEGALN